MPVILFATRNPWKGQQFLPVFTAHGFSMCTLLDLPALQEAAHEAEPTPLLNALEKARRWHSPAFPWVFGDDAGLEIDALHGEPGLQARRWGGIFPDHVDDQTWLTYLLQRMAHVPAGQRSARFVSGWALINPAGQEFTHTMQWPFEIATAPLRPMHPGSPISAVRLGPPDDLRRRQAEIEAEFRRWGILERLRQTTPLEGDHHVNQPL